MPRARIKSHTATGTARNSKTPKPIVTSPYQRGRVNTWRTPATRHPTHQPYPITALSSGRRAIARTLIPGGADASPPYTHQKNAIEATVPPLASASPHEFFRV